MSVLALSRRWSKVALLACAALVLPQAAMAQAPPLTATIFFSDPPPPATPAFGLTAPIPIFVQVKNISGSPVFTTEGFSRTDFFRLLYFTAPGGGTITDTAAALHKTATLFYCFSRTIGGVEVFQSPPIPVVPVETLASTFFLEYSIPDAKVFYPDITFPGRYTVNARIPLSTFVTTDPNAVITNCNQFTGTVVNVGPGAGTGRQDFTVISNNLQFCLLYCTFVGFLEPIDNKSIRTFNFGQNVPVKFQLLLDTGPVVSTAVAFLSVKQLSGSPPPVPPGTLGPVPFDPVRQHYHFDLDTSILAPGVWEISAIIGGHSVHSAKFELR